MIIFKNEILENNSDFIDTIQKEKKIVSLSIKSQEKLKDFLLEAMQRFANSTTSVDASASNYAIQLLNDLKTSLDLSNKNISALKGLLKQFNVIENLNKSNEDSIAENIATFNTTYFETNEGVLNNTMQIEKTLDFTLSSSEFVFSNNIETNLEPISQDNITPSNNLQKEETSKETPIDTNLIKQTNDTNNTENAKNTENTENTESAENAENILIISELKGKVFLPYTVSSLTSTLEKNPNKYSNIEDVIEKEYVLPYELFKNPAIARFREAFKLMRRKEKKSIKKAFDLGMELLFNYNLHPAIISACRNLNELDIYLDYLENNETDKFDCFKIKFEIAPAKIP